MNKKLEYSSLIKKLISCESRKQLSDTIKEINEFNKKYSITPRSEEFKKFEIVIGVMRIKLKREHDITENQLRGQKQNNKTNIKIIITEEQYDRVINSQARNWIRRNYDLVKEELNDTYQLMKNDICRLDYENFEYTFFSVLMDGLHPYFYDIEDFDYKGVLNMLTDFFYVECTEFYFAGREKC